MYHVDRKLVNQPVLGNGRWLVSNSTASRLCTVRTVRDAQDELIGSWLDGNFSDGASLDRSLLSSFQSPQASSTEVVRNGRAHRDPDQGGQGSQRGVLRDQRRLHRERENCRCRTEPPGPAAGPSDRRNRQTGHPWRHRHAHAHGIGVHGNQGRG